MDSQATLCDTGQRLSEKSGAHWELAYFITNSHDCGNRRLNTTCDGPA